MSNRDELAEVIEFDGTYINYHHLALLADRMTCSEKMISVFRHGINNDHIGPIAKASFEETPEMFLKAARHAELDHMRGVSANVMCGQQGYFGTSAFQVILDLNALQSAPVQEIAKVSTNEIIDKIENFHLKRDVLLPAFDIPKEFIDVQDDVDGGKRGENSYLRHLTYTGAKKRYGEITEEISERYLSYALSTITSLSLIHI